MRYTQLNDETWLRNRIEIDKLSLRDIAKIIGCSYGGVSFSVKKYKIIVPEKKSGPKAGTNMREISKESYRKKYPNGRFGKLSSHWKGGRRKVGKYRAYIGIFFPDHPNCTTDGYVLEHRLVMEKSLGRYLRIGELVHHKNGIKDDNRLENLELMEGHKNHARVHFDALKEVFRLRQLLIDNSINPDQNHDLTKR